MTDLDPGPRVSAADRRAARPPGSAAAPGAAAVLAAAFLAAGCATVGGGEDGPGEAPAPRDEPAREAPAPEADRPPPVSLDRARSLLAAEPARALRLADSLYFSLRAGGGSELAPRALRLQVRAAAAIGDTAGAAGRLRELLELFPGAEASEGAALSLARLLRARTDDPGATATLLRHGGDGEETKDVLRQAAGAMSVSELEEARELAGQAEATGSVRALVRAELAEARARAGRPEAARQAAREALASDPDPPDRRTAQSVLDGGIGPDRGPVRVALLLPEEGRYAAVARWIRQGVRIALEEGGSGPEVEVVARDLSGTSPADLMSELEREGVAAVLGPIRAGALAAAARARPEPGLLVVSPTAMRSPEGAPHAYALRDRQRQELDAAAALGRWLGAAVRPGPVGALYPEGELGRRSLLRFRRGLGETGGGWLVASAAYDPDATTLRAPVTQVAAWRPEAVYAGAAGTSSLLQMAPQLAYYGVRAALVVGGPDWTRPGAVRRLDPAFTQFRVGTSFAPAEGGEDTARGGFRAAYETKHRTTLGDNVLPMLGHDSAMLLRRAAAAAVPPRPRALARAFGRLAEVDGATGTLSPDPASGTVRRRVRLRALEDRRLRPTGAGEAREWLRTAGRLEEAGARGRRARARRAVRDAGIPLVRARSESEEEGNLPR